MIFKCFSSLGSLYSGSFRAQMFHVSIERTMCYVVASAVLAQYSAAGHEDGPLGFLLKALYL